MMLSSVVRVPNTVLDEREAAVEDDFDKIELISCVLVLDDEDDICGDRAEPKFSTTPTAPKAKISTVIPTTTATVFGFKNYSIPKLPGIIVSQVLNI
jgi:hypothetical protein